MGDGRGRGRGGGGGGGGGGVAEHPVSRGGMGSRPPSAHGHGVGGGLNWRGEGRGGRGGWSRAGTHLVLDKLPHALPVRPVGGVEIRRAPPAVPRRVPEGHPLPELLPRVRRRARRQRHGERPGAPPPPSLPTPSPLLQQMRSATSPPRPREISDWGTHHPPTSAPALSPGWLGRLLRRRERGKSQGRGR